MHILEVIPKRIGDVFFADIKVELDKSEYFAAVSQNKKYFLATNEISDAKKATDIDYVVRNYYGYETMNTPKKTRHLVQSRSIAWHFMKRFTRLSYEVMGARYERDHSSVSHGLKKLDDLMEIYQEVRDDMNKIEKLLKKFNIYKKQ